jgi:hypothetical protein
MSGSGGVGSAGRAGQQARHNETPVEEFEQKRKVEGLPVTNRRVAVISPTGKFTSEQAAKIAAELPRGAKNPNGDPNVLNLELPIVVPKRKPLQGQVQRVAADRKA